MNEAARIVRWEKPRVFAQLSPDRPAVIEASAGTGKTYTLEHLVVELVLSGDVPIESILVVTYTERAAGELRARIRAKLVELLSAEKTPGSTSSDAAWVIDDAARAKLSRALNSFDLAAISTIHAFCQSMLIENAFLGRRLFDQTLIDGRIAFSRAFISTVRSELARDPAHKPYLEAWLGMANLPKLEDLLYACATMRGAFRPIFDEHKLLALILKLRNERMEEHSLSAVLPAARISHQTVRGLLGRYRKLAALLTTVESTGDLPRVIFEQERHDISYTSLSWMRERLEPAAALDQRVRQMTDLIGILATEIPTPESAIAQRLLPPVTRALEAAKTRRGELDFDDMLGLLWSSLSGPRGGELASAIARRYKVALVDEFQDTDEIQWRIFERVFLEHQPRLPLFVIGDPKQAIYGFRGADVHTYLTATQKIREVDGSHVSLTESYRSTPALIAAVNAILVPKADPPFFSGAIRYDAPVVAARPTSTDDLEGPPVRVLSIVAGDGALNNQIARAALGRRIAEEAARLTASGTVAPNEIFVLTRTTQEANEVGAHLRQKGVPHAFYKREGLFQTREAIEIRTLLLAVEDPEDASRRMRAWLGPFFEVPLESIPGCLELPGTHPLQARLFGWRAIAVKKDYGRLFNAILEESGLLRRLIFFKEGERELTDYLHIFELLLEEGNRTRASLEELIHTLTAFIEERRMPEGDSGNVQRLESERAAVQIMTMHKAKGLEARVVFIYGGLGAGRSRPVEVVHDGDTRVLSLGHDHHRALLEGEREAEDRRLIYVAITRAKERMYLPFFPTLERINGTYAVLNLALQRTLERVRKGDDAALAGLFEEEEIRATKAALEPPPKPSPLGLETFAPDAELIRDVEPPHNLARLARERFGWVVTSYSRLKAARGGYQPPELPAEPSAVDAEVDPELMVSLDLRVESETSRLPGGSTTGRFLHEVLEKVPIETFDAGALAFWRSRADVRQLFTDSAKRYGVDAVHLPHAESLVYVALRGPIELKGLSLSGGIASTDRIVREMEFSYPIPEVDHPPFGETAPHDRLRIGRGFIKGYIDLIFEHRGRLFVVDWKSDFLPSYATDALEVHCAHNYALQADLYTLAVVKMLGLRTFDDYERRFGGTVYCFVRGMSLEQPGAGVRFSRARWSEVLAIDEGLRKGRFGSASEGRDEHE